MENNGWRRSRLPSLDVTLDGEHRVGSGCRRCWKVLEGSRPKCRRCSLSVQRVFVGSKMGSRLGSRRRVGAALGRGSHLAGCCSVPKRNSL